MKWNIINQPLGSSCPVGCSPKKEMPIPLAIPLVMAGASLASSIFGGAKSAKAARRARKTLENERLQTEAERRRKMNEDYIDTAAGQNLLRVARDERDRLWKRTQGAAAVAGGTDAAVALAKESGNRMMGETIASIAGADTRRKDTIDATYRADLARINQQDRAYDQAESQAIAEAASGASNALMQGALSTFGGTKLGQSWFGTGSPGGGGVTGTSRLQQMGQDYKFVTPHVTDYAGKYFNNYLNGVRQRIGVNY